MPTNQDKIVFAKPIKVLASKFFMVPVKYTKWISIIKVTKNKID